MANFVNSGFETDLSSWLAGKQPSDLPTNLRVYNDASQESYNDGDALGTITDHSGNGYNATQSTAALKPTYKNNGTDNVNGNKSYYFDGGDVVQNTSSPSISTDKWTVLTVIKRTDATQPRSFITVDTTGNYPILSRYTDKFLINPSGVGNFATSTSDIPTSAALLLSYYDSTNTKMSVNGEADKSTNQAGAFSYTTGGYNLGDYTPSGGQQYLGFIFFNLQYSTNLSAQSINDLVSYFALRFAITMGSGWGANITRDTTTKRTGSASAKIVTNASYATDAYENINPGSTGNYTLTAYAYTDGSAVTSSDVQLFYDGSAVATTYTSDSPAGWYKLTATVTGAVATKKCGVQVKANKTVYIDDLDLTAEGGSVFRPINFQMMMGIGR